MGPEGRARMSLPLTSQVAHIGNVVKHVLDELVAKNPNFHGQPLLVFGPSEDAANASAPSVYWLPVREQFAPGQRLGAPRAPGPLYNRGVPISFLLFGGVEPEGTYTDAEAPYHDCDLSEILLSKLVNCIHRNLSQQSYEIESAQWFNGGRTGIGMSCELIVTVKVPLIREDNPTVTVTGAKANVEIAHD
jgi:hypothetical protein